MIHVGVAGDDDDVALIPARASISARLVGKNLAGLRPARF
jgi:hypothetical protein